MLVAALGRLSLLLRLLPPGPALRAPAETVLQGRVEAAAQLGVLGAQAGALGEELAHQRLERGHVVGQRGVGSRESGVHAVSNTGSGGG